MANNSKAMMEAKKRIETWDGMHDLDLNNIGLTVLPELPETLTALFCNDNKLTSLPPLSDKIKFIECHNNQLTSLPILPEKLIYLDCENNKLTSLPDLPAGIKTLYFNKGNNIRITENIFNAWINCSRKNILEDFSPENQKIINDFKLKKNIKNLKSHKNTVIDFTPSKGYFIKGHGDEGDDTFIVPKDCIIVVKGHQAETRSVDLIYEEEAKLCTLSAETLKDPINFSSDIINAVGSVLIFKEGDKCPNYNYQLFSIYPEHDGFRTIDYRSGLLDIDKYESLCNVYDSREAFPVNDPIDIPYITKGFEASVMPTQEEIQNVVNTLKNKNLNTLLKNDELNTMINVSQKDIIRKIGTGVYYNFVCRATPITELLYEEQFEDDTHHIRQNILGKSYIDKLSKFPQEKMKNIYSAFKNTREAQIIESKKRAKLFAESNNKKKNSFFGMAPTNESQQEINNAIRNRNIRKGPKKNIWYPVKNVTVSKIENRKHFRRGEGTRKLNGLYNTSSDLNVNVWNIDILDIIKLLNGERKNDRITLEAVIGRLRTIDDAEKTIFINADGIKTLVNIMRSSDLVKDSNVMNLLIGYAGIFTQWADENSFLNNFVDADGIKVLVNMMLSDSAKDITIMTYLLITLDKLFDNVKAVQYFIDADGMSGLNNLDTIYDIKYRNIHHGEGVRNWGSKSYYDDLRDLLTKINDTISRSTHSVGGRNSRKTRRKTRKNKSKKIRRNHNKKWT